MTEIKPNPLTLTETEARQALKVSRSTLQKLRANGLYHLKVGRKVLYTQRSIDDFFNRLEHRDK